MSEIKGVLTKHMVNNILCIVRMMISSHNLRAFITINDFAPDDDEVFFFGFAGVH